MYRERANLLHSQRIVRKALEVHAIVDNSLREPIDIFELVESLDIVLRIEAISGDDGFYLESDHKLIKISNKRPFVRQRYTCAHELGHVMLGHPSFRPGVRNEQNESDAQLFAGALLLTQLALQTGVAKRGWKLSELTFEHVQILASWFGVSIEALLLQMFGTYHCITKLQFESLREEDVKRNFIEGSDLTLNELALHIDEHWSGRSMDIHVDDTFSLPKSFSCLSDKIVEIRQDEQITLFRAIEKGLVQVKTDKHRGTFMLRIADRDFSGFARDRFN